MTERPEPERSTRVGPSWQAPPLSRGHRWIATVATVIVLLYVVDQGRGGALAEPTPSQNPGEAVKAAMMANLAKSGPPDISPTDIEVSGTVLYLVTTRSDKARQQCAAIADLTTDPETGRKLDITEIVIKSGTREVSYCHPTK